ncbi:MFS general substrate transporter, partial [Aureobasidium melanogenum]
MAAPHQTFAMDGLEGLEKKNLSAEHLEIVATQSEHNIEWLARFPLIADKSPEELRKIEKGLLRKLDWIFLPVVTLMLLMGYLDRINVGNARLAGMQKDLGMDDTTYSLGISAFYIGYIISQLPATIYLARGRPQIQMPIHVVIWSVITSFGVAEGPFLPMVSLMSSSWYTKEEAPLRMAIWHAGNIASNIFSGLLAAAILTTMEGINGIAAWSWFFIIEGSVGVFVGLAGFYCIPNFPHNHNVKWLTDEQAQMAQYRMLVSSGGVSEDDDTSAWKGVWLACKDPFTWIYTVLHFGLIVSLSEKDFFPSIVKTLGYSKLMTYLIQAPPYVFAYIATLVISWSAGRYKEHCYHIVGSSMLTIVGAAIVIGTYNPGARYFGMFFMCAGPFVGLNIHVPWETTNVFTPRSKRAAVVSITNSIASVSHWFTPYLFLTKQAPLYQEGGAMILSGAVLATTMLHWYTPDGPAFVSHDTSEYWLKIGVGLAYQIGLHKEPPPGPQRAIRRRMWWSLVVRDSLISVSRGRPRAVNLEDSDVSMPTLDDFADAPETGELFIAYVEVCCILGDLVQTCARRRITTSKRTEVMNGLFKWTRMLPARLMLAQYSVDTRSYEARPHDFLARQLHVPYFTSIIILARSGATGEIVSSAAVMAASFVAGIYEDFLARNLVGLLSPTFTTFAFVSGLVLRSLRSYPGLWPAARKDLETILASLQQLSNRWRSAIGAYKVIQRALDHPVPTSTSPKRSLLSLSREEAPLFEGFPLHICRMWHASEAERAAQNVDFNLSDILPPQMDLAAERGGNSQAAIMNLNLLPDDSLFDVPFDNLPDYFWGGWKLNG